MEYTKPPRTFEDQADQLISRGLIADKPALVQCLSVVNYYRLSGYLYPFRQRNSDEFISGTTLDEVWQRYTFDRHLRLLVIDGIERIEVSVKTQLVYEFSHLYGAFGHLDIINLPKIKQRKYNALINRIKEETDRSNEIFVKHFFNKYGDKHQYLPLWMTAELMSFGTMLTFFRAVSPAVKRKIAAFYNIPYQLLFKWLIVLNGVRNTCAHHGRLWNKKYSLSLPNHRKYPDWYVPVKIPQDRIFGIVTILKYMLGIIAPQSQWPQRLQDLLLKYPNIPLKPMGFPANWKDSPLWR